MNRERPRKIMAVFLMLAMLWGMIPQGAYASPTGAITLIAVSPFQFGNATEGYGAQASYGVRVDSTGSDVTGDLTIGLSGANPTAFTLTTNTIPSLAVGASSNFNITPALGLSAGSYSATVTVSGAGVVSKNVIVNFTVDPAGSTYNAVVRYTVDGTDTDAPGVVDIREGSTTYPLSKISTGTYRSPVPNGSYTVYVNGANTGHTLTISGLGNTKILEYYTVTFSAIASGTTTTATVGATVDGAVITSGTPVLKGKTVSLTATGTGAGSYDYTWTGTDSGTNGTLTLTNLGHLVSVNCVIAGTGIPPALADYVINGSNYRWTGSNQTIALSGSSDTLEIKTNPTAVIKIEVQSSDGAHVALKGNSVPCTNIRVDVSNDITLDLEDIDITAPANNNAMTLNTDGTSGTMVLNILGTCKLTGTGTGSAIRSEHDQDLTIQGSGTLTATGGGNNSGSDGATGIFMIGYTHGSQLTIDGTPTIHAIGGTSLTNSGGTGILVGAGSYLQKSGIVNATSGRTYGTNSNSSYGLCASFPSDHSIGGNVVVEGGTLNATGGYADFVSGGYGIYAFNGLKVSGGAVTATGGNSGCTSTTLTGGAGIVVYEQKLEVTGGRVTGIGGDGVNCSGGPGIYLFYKDALISSGTVTATGGNSTNKNGGIGMSLNSTGNMSLTGGQLSSKGGNGGVNGAHGIYVARGTFTAETGAALDSRGGNGSTNLGGVGVRAAGYDGTTLFGNTVTIPNTAGTVYIRGGQGATAQRASIMGKDVYVATGNIGTILMEGTNPRSIKNQVGGDAVYQVNVTAAPASAITVQSVVAGTLGTYTYKAGTLSDGKASMWLPAGSRVVTATGFASQTKVVPSDDTGTVALTTGGSSGGGSGSGGSGSGAGTTAAPPNGSSAIVEVNGQKQDAGTAQTATEGGQTVTTIQVDDAKLDKILSEKGSQPTVTLPMTNDSKILVGALNGQTLKNMEVKEAILEVRSPEVTYVLPAAQVQIEQVASDLGTAVALKDIQVNIRIAESPEATTQIVANTAAANQYQVVVKPVDFQITCTYGSKTVAVDRFNGYVERMVAIPAGVDPSKITTGIVLNGDGSFYHAPTQVVVINGAYFAKINSLTNSTYSVIYNPMTFSDVETHWGKTAINDMGSRLVVKGNDKGLYEPERNMTRAEFAAISVRALGLKPGMGSTTFKDVSKDAWYEGSIRTAAEYGIIKGYDSGNFGPNDTISREQAMTMLGRAMKLTGLKTQISQTEIDQVYKQFADGGHATEYAKNAIALCIQNQIVSGVNSSTIAPKDPVTRAEVATMYQRLLKKSGLI